MYQFKRCDGLLLCKLIVIPQVEVQLFMKGWQRGVSSGGFVALCAEASRALTELSGSLSGTCFQTSPPPGS